MVHVREIIVVEGRYDKNTLSQVVDAVIIETSGFGIFRDGEKLKLIKKLAEKRGVVVLTDSDSAGFLIRSHLKSTLRGLRVLHAYIPDVKGKERRKAQASAEGMLGVEGMRPETLLEALRRAGATLDDEAADFCRGRSLTKADLYADGFAGCTGSAEKRKALLRELGLPERLSANGLIEVINAAYGFEEYRAAADRL